MSSIHYKFKATLEYKTLVFNGLHISVSELKKEISDAENIKTDLFDLILTNAHTKRQYVGEELIPRNSSVIVQRMPRDSTVKIPKIQDTFSSGIASKTIADQSNVVLHIEPDQFEKMSESERLAHVKEASAFPYSSANFQKKTISIMTGTPPPTYVCNRCSQQGHWYKNCPMLNTRRTTGITMDELMETTSDDPRAMLHSSGKYMVPIMHWKARQQKKIESTNNSDQENRATPLEFTCFLCKLLLRDAVVTTCCGESFCAECIQQCLLESSNAKCPGSGCCQNMLSADKLVPNIKVRQAVEAFKNVVAVCSQGITSYPTINTTSNDLRKDSQEKASSIDEDSSINSRKRDEQSNRLRIELINRSTLPSVQASQTVVIKPSVTNPVIEPFVSPAVGHSDAPSSQLSTISLRISPQLPSAPAQPVVNLNTSEHSLNSIANVIQSSNPTFHINLSQPPPGYSAVPTITSGSIDPRIFPSNSRDSSVNPMQPESHHAFYSAGLQPPPPGLTSANNLPRITVPTKDAWDEFIERKEKEKIAQPRRRHRHSRSRTYSRSTSHSSSSASSSRSRSPSWLREHSRRKRYRIIHPRRNNANRSRSPLHNLCSSSRQYLNSGSVPCSYHSVMTVLPSHRCSLSSGLTSSQLSFGGSRQFRSYEERVNRRCSPRRSDSTRRLCSRDTDHRRLERNSHSHRSGDRTSRIRDSVEKVKRFKYSKDDRETLITQSPTESTNTASKKSPNKEKNFVHDFGDNARKGDISGTPSSPSEVIKCEPSLSNLRDEKDEEALRSSFSDVAHMNEMKAIGTLQTRDNKNQTNSSLISSVQDCDEIKSKFDVVIDDGTDRRKRKKKKKRKHKKESKHDLNKDIKHHKRGNESGCDSTAADIDVNDRSISDDRKNKRRKSRAEKGKKRCEKVKRREEKKRRKRKAVSKKKDRKGRYDKSSSENDDQIAARSPVLSKDRGESKVAAQPRGDTGKSTESCRKGTRITDLEQHAKTRIDLDAKRLQADCTTNEAQTWCSRNGCQDREIHKAVIKKDSISLRRKSKDENTGDEIGSCSTEFGNAAGPSIVLVPEIAKKKKDHENSTKAEALEEQNQIAYEKKAVLQPHSKLEREDYAKNRVDSMRNNLRSDVRTLLGSVESEKRRRNIVDTRDELSKETKSKGVNAAVARRLIELTGFKRKTISRENVFETSPPALGNPIATTPKVPFNARQKIKMILLTENERFGIKGKRT